MADPTNGDGLIGLPQPPAVGASALPSGHVRRRERVRHRRRHRARQGDRGRVRAPRRVDRDREPQARAPRRRPRGDRGARRAGAHGRLRHPRRRPDRRRVRRGRATLRSAGRARQQRGRQLPGARRGHVAERVAHGRRHHVERHVLVLSRVRPPSHRDGTPGSIINVGASYAWTGGPASCTRPRPRPA